MSSNPPGSLMDLVNAAIDPRLEDGYVSPKVPSTPPKEHALNADKRSPKKQKMSPTKNTNEKTHETAKLMTSNSSIVAISTTQTRETSDGNRHRSVSNDANASKPSSLNKDKDKPNNPVAANSIYDGIMDEISDLLSAAEEAQALGRLKMTSTYLILSHIRLLGLGQRFDRSVVHLNNGQPLDDDVSNRTTTSEEGKKSQQTASPAVNSMMEHLARAATEYYRQRTNRSKSKEKEGDKTKLNINVSSTKTEKSDMLNHQHMDHLSGKTSASAVDPSKTNETKGAKGSKNDRASKKRLKSGDDQEDDDDLEEGDEDDDGGDDDDDEDGGDEEEGPVRPRGRRGKKPPTQAIQTVQNANFDFREIIMNWLLSKKAASSRKQEGNEVGVASVNEEAPIKGPPGI